MIWKPNVTVAAVIEHGGKFLLIEEETSQGLRYNQPAGHLEAHESLIAAVVRETLEESAYHFTPQHLLGIYRWHSSESDTIYLRFAFTGKITAHEAGRKLDNGIMQTLWLSPRTNPCHPSAPPQPADIALRGRSHCRKALSPRSVSPL